ncbi:MAG: hypothetical protein QW607_11760 [Desulfurococcaceae archaeon]
MEIEVKDARMRRKVELAAQRGTRVLPVRTIDTHIILDIASQADRVINYLRKNIVIKFEPEEVVRYLREYQEAVRRLHEVTYRMCKFAGTPYRVPRGFEEPLDEEAKEGVISLKKEKKAELLEQAYRE